MARLTNLKPTIGSLKSRLAPPPKVAAPVYRSKEWRSLLSRIKRERGAFCAECGGTHRLIGDHVIELSDGGAAFDASNIRLLCQACHNRKTAKARAARAGGGRKSTKPTP